MFSDDGDFQCIETLFIEGILIVFMLITGNVSRYFDELLGF